MTDQNETPQTPEAGEEPVMSALEMMRVQQTAFITLCQKEGIEGGLASLVADFQRTQMKLASLCLFVDPRGKVPPEGAPPEALDLHEGMHESLSQARIRLHEVGGWIDTAANQRRTLAMHMSRKAPPAEPGPEGNGLDNAPPPPPDGAEPSGE
jgi:hypothetical protein